MGTRAKQNRVAVENTQLDQRAKEDDLLKFFKEHSWVFCIKLNNMLLLTSQTFGGSFKEIFKKVVVQNCPLDQI